MQFSELLHQGRIPEAIESRLQSLENASADFKTDIDVSKGASLALLLVSVPLSTTPIGLVGAMIGGISYAFSVYSDTAKTRRIYPLPGIRKDIGELFAGATFGGNDAPDMLQETTGFLSESESFEYELLIDHGDKIGPLLAQLEPDSRPLAYQHVLRQLKAKGILPAAGEVQAHLSLSAAAAPSEKAQDTATAPPAGIGQNTRLTAVEVPSAPAVSVSVPVDIHNHLGAATRPATKTANPPQSDRRIEPPDLALYPDPQQRLQVWLKACSQSGFPVGQLMQQPFVWCWGRSQSGKTTIALLLAIARMVSGRAVSYFTTDNDYPKQVSWGRVEDSPEGYSVALDEVRSTISSAGKGQLKPCSWIFDEVLAAAAEHQINIQPLLTCVLMKGAKTGGGIVAISQADTSSAHGLKGLDAAWRCERVSIEAIHSEDELGNRHPTGRYLVANGDNSEEWHTPEWMLTELNDWGHPDPVVWLLNRFPEVVTNSGNDGNENRNESETVTGNGNGNETAVTKKVTNVTTQQQGLQRTVTASETILKRFPETTETTETTLFYAIFEGFRNGFSPSDIVKNSLKMGKDSYSDGKAIAIYLVRKFGNADLINHFAKWLD